METKHEIITPDHPCPACAELSHKWSRERDFYPVWRIAGTDQAHYVIAAQRLGLRLPYADHDEFMSEGEIIEWRIKLHNEVLKIQSGGKLPDPPRT